MESTQLSPDVRDAWWRLTGESTAAAESRAPGLVTRFDPGFWSVTSDVNAWAGNWFACWEPTSSTEASMRAFLTQAVAGGRPTVGFVSTSVLDSVAPLAVGLPVERHDAIPVMVRTGRPLEREGFRYEGTVRKLAAGTVLRPTLDVIADAFDTPRDLVATAFVGLLDHSPLSVHVAETDAVEGVCVAYRSAGTMYIHIMATAPERQRRGAGRAVLTHVMNEAADDSVEQFFLIASEAGQPLYRSLGYETTESPEFWSINPTPLEESPKPAQQ